MVSKSNPKPILPLIRPSLFAFLWLFMLIFCLFVFAQIQRSNLEHRKKTLKCRLGGALWRKDRSHLFDISVSAVLCCHRTPFSRSPFLWPYYLLDIFFPFVLFPLSPLRTPLMTTSLPPFCLQLWEVSVRMNKMSALRKKEGDSKRSQGKSERLPAGVAAAKK